MKKAFDLLLSLPCPSWMPSWDNISRRRSTSSLSSRISLALGSSLTTALHIICLALSAYLFEEFKTSFRNWELVNIMYFVFLVWLWNNQVCFGWLCLNPSLEPTSIKQQVFCLRKLCEPLMVFELTSQMLYSMLHAALFWSNSH